MLVFNDSFKNILMRYTFSIFRNDYFGKPDENHNCIFNTFACKPIFLTNYAGAFKIRPDT